MVVDAAGQGLTAREQPRLLGIAAEIEGDRLQLSAPGRAPLALPLAPAPGGRLASRIWGSEVQASAVGAAADAWLSAHLGLACRLAFMDDEARRLVGGPERAAGAEVSFADAYPLLVLSAAALEELNGRLAQPLDRRRFRPNLVIGGCAAHAEDGWRQIRIGGVELAMAGPCDRCVMTTIDPASGQRDPVNEPMRTLAGYRRGTDGRVYFGCLAIPRRTGRLRLGDPVEVLA
jgi:hypothetical protein